MNFAAGTAITTAARVGSLLLGLATSVVVARILGPQGNGVLTLSLLLPTLIVTFTNLGIGPAISYFVASKRYPLSDMAGISVLWGAAVSIAGTALGLVVALSMAGTLFPSVAQTYLLFGLARIPTSVFHGYLACFLLGSHKIKEYNLAEMLNSFLSFALVTTALWALQSGIQGAILATALAALVTDMVLLLWVRRTSGIIEFRLRFDYFKSLAAYGVKSHIGNTLAFLNLRIDVFMVNVLLSPTAVGFYAIGVAIAERLWLISQAASTLLFPRVAAETNEQRRKAFTPLVSRTVLTMTAVGALLVLLVSRWIVELLFTSAFMPSVVPLQLLLPGIVALGVARVLSNDLSGRGRPELNLYVALVTVSSNVVLNALWIPRLGIAGAALASSVSYSASLALTLFIYCRISTNAWTVVLLPQHGDWGLYRETGLALMRNLKTMGRR